MLRTHRRRSRALLLLVALSGGVARAADQTGTAAPATGAPQTAPTTSATPARDDDHAQPPAGEWLRDAEGREYYGEVLRLKPGTYVWLDDAKTRARIPGGIDVEILAHDDATLTMKVYRTDDGDDDEAPVRGKAPSAADQERVAASYRSDATEGRGLKLVPFDRGLPQRGQWRNGFSIADVDGDAKADIVFAPPRKSRRPPVVFRGDGAGGWSVWQEATFPALPFDYGDAAVGDLNGDGKADVVIASHLRGIVATIGDGKGGFSAWTKGIDFGLPGDAQAVPQFTSRAVALGDWNRDGRLDVIALGEGPQLAVAPGRTAMNDRARGLAIYLNDGDGTWQRAKGPASGIFGSALAVEDVDGDGRLDVLAASERRGSRSLLNLGQADVSWKETEIAELRPNALFRAVAIADFDRDGKKDLAVSFLASELGSERRGIDVLLARDGGWQRRTLLAEASRTMIGALASGDVDGDGNADVVAADDKGELHVFRGDGRGGFAREPLVDVPPTKEHCRAYGVRLANVDGVPGDEIVVAFADDGETSALSGGGCTSQGALRAWRISP